MKIAKFKNNIPIKIFELLLKRNFTELRPAQAKAIKEGLFKNNNLLICTPTASGKTLVAEFAVLNTILEKKQKAVYMVPLKALASEKFSDFNALYRHLFKIALSVGDIDSSDPLLANYDLIIVTSEKLDSLIRHDTPWLREVGVIIVDEVHLLNDTSRGPTLEILLTMLRKLLLNLQIVALSATIGNPEELAAWLDAKLIKDPWRPVRLDKGVYLDGKVEFK